MAVGGEGGRTIETIEAGIGEHDQILPFEPMRPQKLWGSAGEPTIGGMVATNLAGPRRLSAGAVRDGVLGVRLVNGLGQAIRCGGGVEKDFTALGSATLKVVPHVTPRHAAEETAQCA